MTVPGDHAILFVHAHPDDESIGTGATMAAYAARGVAVCLVTCTLGEEGEIALTDLAGLAAGQADQLGGYRLTELGQACAALGVTDHRMLGGAGRYRDSGMAGLPSNEHPRAFCRAELDTAATELLAVIDDVRPSVVVTYDPQGFYGHPDHVMAHRVTHRACERAAAAGIGPRKIYWTALPQPVVAAGLAAFARTTGNPFADARSPDDLPFAAPAELVTTRIDAAAFAAAKTRAMLAHATQLPATSWLFMVASNFGAEPLGVEFFRLAFGDRGRGSGRFGWESDLLAGPR